VIVARGEGKTITRVLPLFSQAHDDEQESDFYLWPIYRYNHLHAGVLDRRAHPHLVLFVWEPDGKEHRHRRRPPSR
jgi:hypothetical protein